MADDRFQENGDDNNFDYMEDLHGESPPNWNYFAPDPETVHQQQTLERPFPYRVTEYPCICPENKQSITIEKITEIFERIQVFFGFQKDSMRNVLEHFLVQLDSRASRMSAADSLITLHLDYIAGDNANYRKWYFSAMLEIDGVKDMALREADMLTKEQREHFYKLTTTLDSNSADALSENMLRNDVTSRNFKRIEYRWKLKHSTLTPEELVEQIALYLLVWGESNQLRFTPEALCFVYKLAYDKLNGSQKLPNYTSPPEGHFLDTIITPLYTFLKRQTYKLYDGKFIKRDRDHKLVIGYDDVNQLFWYRKGLERITLKKDSTKIKLMGLPANERYDHLGEVVWRKVFYKTYQERRTWMHLFTNFNRIWIIHLSSFWYYTAFNSPTLYTPHYDQRVDNQPLPQVVFSVVSLGGVIACLVQLIATAAEWTFVPRKWPGAQLLSLRFTGILLITALNIAPAVYVLGFASWSTRSPTAYAISIAQFVLSIITFAFFSVSPLGGLFGSYLKTPKSRESRYYASSQFTANFPKLATNDRFASYLLWVIIFSCKFTESYYFLTLSIRDPIRVLSIMSMRCTGETYYGDLVCKYQPQVVLTLMYVIDLILFFLDTYLWYIVCNCVFSCISSYKAGFSVLSPWKNQYGVLPKRIYTKILATSEMEVKYKPSILISQVWNSIVISMYKEHALTLLRVQKLLYRHVESEEDGKFAIKDPLFFVEKGDATSDVGTTYFPKNSEAERRLSFFARSLASNVPEPVSVEGMPVFTVLVPHYSEKIILSLKEVIRENDSHLKISLLEYLKVLFPDEWECFVNDTRIMAAEKLKEENDRKNEKYYYNHVSTEQEYASNPYWSKILDKPFLLVGYKSEIPEFTLRTRIWASLRSQTLYRTVSGFMNYGKALKLLYRVENPELIADISENGGGIEEELEMMAFRKFKMVVSMQRYSQFDADERENAEFLLRAYPHLKIAYLEKVACANDDERAHSDDGYFYYSCLIDGNSPIDEKSGLRKPYYRIRLSGNPILGDGKADNQNHAIIFYRGEYIQVIDANQDNYLEECLKIRSVLSEFEEITQLNVKPYVPDFLREPSYPVAIVGSREYIFSENTGVLGDVAAGKEQTFGTLFARTLAKIGGKLHYGHPDFLNGIFMTTRGGISKAQKGLHLNEDIYAGMTAVCRGGRIKHSDYYQCGKGRDLGFGSILNFTTKIGAGMGEQLLSREYYYLGTQLPLDKFLSFYYAHAGFHINNLLIILSMSLFTCVVLNLGALNSESIRCMYDRHKPITDPELPYGCYNITPVLDWITRFVLSIFICFFIAFLPLVLQEFTERGLWKAVTRLTFHFLSLSPLFEVFVCQIYATALTSNMEIGGAQYISSGRGFAMARVPFCEQYSKFATTSMYSGAYLFIVMLFTTMTMWQPAILWFWITTTSLCLAPFLFNPHQYAFSEFFLDYKEFVRWLTRGNTKYHPKSWITYMRESRSRLTGYRKSKLAVNRNSQKPSFWNVFLSEVISSVFYAISSFAAYTFINAQTGVKDASPVNSIMRLGIVVFLPIVCNIVIVLISVPISLVIGSTLRCCCKLTAAIMASIAHCVALMCHIVTWELLWFLEGWSLLKAILGLLSALSIQNIIFRFIICLLSREERQSDVNKAWWDGSWIEAKTNTFKLFLFVREFTMKVVELSMFSLDFILGHCLLFIQTPLLLVPYMDKWHSMMLFWLKPSHKILVPTVSPKRRKKRLKDAMRYAVLYALVMLFLLALIAVPPFTNQFIPNVDALQTGPFRGLIQPTIQNNNDTGPARAPTKALLPPTTAKFGPNAQR